MLKERTRFRFDSISENVINGNLKDAWYMLDMLNREELVLFAMQAEGQIKRWLERTCSDSIR